MQLVKSTRCAQACEFLRACQAPTYLMALWTMAVGASAAGVSCLAVVHHAENV